MSNLSSSIIKNNSYASSALDLLRFSSALVVFLFHFYVPLPGHQAVMVFFVLSGYFISASVLKSTQNNTWRWSEYLLKRITRLWIVLLPALFLTYIVAKVQLGFFGEEFSPENLKVSEFINLKLFLGNLFFVQGILVEGPFGLNGPLWSLTYEFWYYILFPCIVLIFRSDTKEKKLLFILLSTAISIFLGQKIMTYFLIWMLGAIIPLIPSVKFKYSYIKNTLLLTIFLIAISTLDYEAGSSYYLDLRVGLTFALLIYLIVSFWNKGIVKYNIPKYFAAFSYTLYLTHYPLANLILTWRVSPSWPFEGNSIFIKLTLAGLVFGYAWIIGLLTEKHTDTIRKQIYHFLIKKVVKPIQSRNLSANILLGSKRGGSD